MKDFNKKILTLLISFSMMIGTLPIMSFATEDDSMNESTEVQPLDVPEENQQNPTNQNEENYDGEGEIMEEQKTEELNQEKQQTYTVYYHFVEDLSNEEVIKPLVYTNVLEGEVINFSADIESVFEKLESEGYHNTSTNMASEYKVGDSTPEASPNENNEVHFYAYCAKNEEDKENKENQAVEEKSQEDTNTENAVEEKDSYTAVLNYVDINTNKKIKESREVTLKAKTFYNLSSAEDIDGYTFVKVAGAAGGVPERDIQITYYYEKVRMHNINVYYLDIFTGESIARSTTQSELVGNSDYTYKCPNNIGNYKLVDVIMYGCDDSLKDVDIYCLYYNTKLNKGQHRIIINYLEEGTNKTLAEPFVSQKIEDGYKYNAAYPARKSISGYEYVRTIGNVSGVINGRDVVINVYYKKVAQYNVTVNYIDVDGNKIAKPIVLQEREAGIYYDVSGYNAIKIDGYTYCQTKGDPLRGILDSHKVINVIYRKTSEFNVKTGDNTNIFLWIGVGFIALVALVFVLLRKKRNIN